MAKVFLFFIEIILLILNILSLIVHFQNGDYKTACLNAGAIGLISGYLIYFFGWLFNGED